VDLFRSDDGGGTWAGPFPIERGKPAGDFGDGIYLSPNFANDQTLYVNTFDGPGYLSTDRGATFTTLDGTAAAAARPTSHPVLSPIITTAFLDGVPGGGAGRPDLIVGGAPPGCCDTIFDPVLPPRSTPPSGQVVSELYIVPPDFPSTRQAVVLSQQQGVGPPQVEAYEGHARAYGCVGEFVCDKVLYDFAPFRAGDDTTWIDWDGPTSYPSSADNYVVISSGKVGVFDPNPPTRAFRSSDFGRTWAVWTSVSKLLSAFGGGEEIFVNASPDAPHRLFLHLTGGANPASIPDEQLYRSDDNGATWHRIGFAWGPKQKARSRSTLPWNATPIAYGTTVVEPGGRLYLVGEHDTGKRTDYTGLYCSHDYGVHWSTTC
jgi:hypothetical protein